MTNIQLGDEIQTLGFPDYGNNTITYSNGVVSNFWMDDGDFFKDHDGVLAIGTSAKISHGSSGGAAFDKDGYLLGITSAEILDGNGSFLSGVIIPITTFNWWWEKVLGYEIIDGVGYTTGSISKEMFCKILYKDYDKLHNTCVCPKGYTENSNQECIAGSTPGSDVKIDNSTSLKIDPQLTNRLKGYILLQVQSQGEAWYVNSVDGKRYYMKDGSTAYEMMRKFALGITNSDLAKIPQQGEDKAYLSALSNLKGKILLQVESHGEAWYVHPKTGIRYYMKDGEAAYALMRYHSLGITNADLDKIPEGIL